MKSGNTYRFTLSWPMETEEQVIAGEFLSKLGYKKSKFIIQLICDIIYDIIMVGVIYNEKYVYT